jgi:hypothetical protein
MRRMMGKGSQWTLLALITVGISGCEGVLEIDQGGIIVLEDVLAGGPSAVEPLVNGMVATYQEAVDDLIRYASLLTDEMILAGTFETRAQVDRREIQPNNDTLEDEMYAPLHVARMQADTVVEILQTRLQDPAFASVEEEMREGIALGKLFGGLTRLWLAELYCWSILTGMYPEAAPLTPNQRVQQALTFLQDAETRAAIAGFEDIRIAAIAAQARAFLWLRNYTQAGTLASEVPRDFRFWAEYSQNDPVQFNEMFMFTWGRIQQIQWTVGDGTVPTRGGERFEHLDRFISLNLIRDEPEDFTATVSSIPVMLQTLYGRADAKVLVASGTEAMLIRAETLVRSGQTQAAQDLLNDLRSDHSFRATVQWNVSPPSELDELQPLVLVGDLGADVKTVADERARELWLTGDRLTTSRRLRLDPTVDINLFPPVKTAISGGDDIAFPMVQVELDNNPNLSPGQACPAGQAAGSWR